MLAAFRSSRISSSHLFCVCSV